MHRLSHIQKIVWVLLVPIILYGNGSDTRTRYKLLVPTIRNWIMILNRFYVHLDIMLSYRDNLGSILSSSI